MFKNLLDVFLKPNCSLCRRSTNNCVLCQDCQRQLKDYQLQNPSLYWRGNLPLLAWGKYEGKLKQAIASLKYENHPEIGELMGIWLGETWLKTLPVGKDQKLTIIPIPLHSQKLKERGFNQAEAIAQGFCQVTGYNLNKQGLIRCKDTAPLFSLSPQERQKNMQGAFRVSISFQKKLSTTPILLIDDIYTTGITAREASRILRAVGINVLGITVIAMVKR